MERSSAASKGKCIQCRPFLVLLLLLFLQLALFALTVIMSYAVESGVAHLHHILFDLKPPLPLETSLMLYCVSLIAECITEVQHKNWTILSVKNHHIMLIVIPNIVYILIFSLAFINIFIEFQAFHTLDTWHFEVPEASKQTALYMLSISYIIFCLTRLIRKDLFQLFISLPHHQHSHSVVILIAFLSQGVSTALYSIPLVVSGYVASIYQFHIATEFVVLNIIGLGMGIIGSYVETKVPWPKKRKSKPYFLYENLIYSRVVLLEVILLPSFHYLFFEPGKLNFLYTNDRHVIYFTFCAAISLQHVVKILTTAVMQHGSADLIFGWAWGTPDLRTRNHMSQSGLDGGFLRDGDHGDQDSTANESSTESTNAGINSSENCFVATININDQPQQASSNNNTQETQFASANNFQLHSFSLPRDLIQTPIAAVISYGFRCIRKLDFDPNLTEHTEDENITANYSQDDILHSEHVCAVPMQDNSMTAIKPTVNSDDTNLNNIILVPGIPNKGVDNLNNNFRNQSLLLTTDSHSN